MPNRSVTRNDDDQCGHCANNHRIDERFQQCNDAFTDRLVGFSRGVRDGGRTDARLIGKRRTLESNDKHPNQSTIRRIRGESARNDEAKCTWNLGDVSTQYDQRPEDVNANHERNDLIRNSGDTFDATNDDESNQDGHNGTEHPALSCQERLLSTGNLNELLRSLIDLYHVATAETPSDACDGKQHRQNFTELRFALLCQAVSQVVHGTA